MAEIRGVQETFFIKIYWFSGYLGFVVTQDYWVKTGCFHIVQTEN
jgi:hypothetical protein